ncbi:MAG: hypothetical protein EPO32_12800 [Anaerolineae bacterium]|nr:MAG: hypothetical protein EPO32_12800 [Anaerolineae bacterium]
MADYKPMIKEKAIKMDSLTKALGNKAHDVYILYDDTIDELVVRFEFPRRPTAFYYAREGVDLIINTGNNMAIGIVFSEFTTRHVPALKGLLDVWNMQGLPEVRGYKKVHYKPSGEDTQPYYSPLRSSAKSLKEALAH